MSGIINSVQIFPDNHIWNRRIDDLPIHTLNDAWIRNIGSGVRINCNSVGGIPINVSHSSDALIPVTFGDTYRAYSTPGPYRIPLSAAIEANSDGHCLCYDVDNSLLYELYQAVVVDGAWQAAAGVIWNLRTNDMRTSGWTSCDASGGPIAQGVLRVAEILDDATLEHALRFIVPATSNTFVWPASHQAGVSNNLLPAMGARIRLKQNYPINDYDAQFRIFLNTLKKYGGIVTDNGGGGNGNSAFMGEPSSRWAGTFFFGNAFLISPLYFEFVDETELQANANSYQQNTLWQYPGFSPSWL